MGNKHTSDAARSNSSSGRSEFHKKYAKIDDNYNSLDEVKKALVEAGVESSNLIVGIDFTSSNNYKGQQSFHEKSLHHLGDILNPYEHAISIIGRTLSTYDEDNLIPCFGFGDVSTHDKDVFSFYPDHEPCNGFEEALRRYREIAPYVKLSGPTSYAPIIETAIGIVDKSGGQYHILLIIVDGEVSTCSDNLSLQEQCTINAIVKASQYPLSIILVGVGDGPWDMMHRLDDNIPDRAFDNIQFVNFTKIMSENTPIFKKETDFALATLMEIPNQYGATLDLHLLGNRIGNSAKQPLPPPVGRYTHPNYSGQHSFVANPGSSLHTRTCPICFLRNRDLVFGCGHQTCYECGKDIPHCLACGKRIVNRIKIND